MELMKVQTVWEELRDVAFHREKLAIQLLDSEEVSAHQHCAHPSNQQTDQPIHRPTDYNLD